MKLRALFAIRQPLDRQTAWACFLANTVMLPGLGSLIAGRRQGFLQIAGAFIGTLLLSAFAFWFVREFVQAWLVPELTGPWVLAGIAGAAIVILSWLWGLITGIQIVNAANNQPPRQGKNAE